MAKFTPRYLIISFLIALLFAITLFSAEANADRMGMRDHNGYGMGPNAFGKLNLSEQQRQQINDIQRAMRKQLFPIMDQMRAEQDKIAKLMNAEKRDAKAIGAAYEPVYKLQRDMLKLHIDTANKIDAVLTAEQHKELREWRDEMHSWRHGEDDDDNHPGMMGRGPGMMSRNGDCGGYGGMGMMGGYGGMGTMGGYGGMGMMGGYGGMGMMGEYHPMGMGPLGMLNLSDEQRNKLYDIQKASREQQWKIMEEMDEAMDKVSELMHADKRDAKAILAAHEPLFKLHRQMVENGVNTANQIDALLTKEQRDELREWRQHGGYGMGMGMMMGW